MTSATVSSYSEGAMRIAAQIHAHRAEQRAERANQKPDLRSLVPATNRAALGVYAEYEQMGNRPVTPELEARAAAAGVEFEHLGLTLGTVLHNVDLRHEPDAEATQLIRDTLLERKVIFFRDQHLDEQEHVAFARRFGDLDAFPFGTPGADPLVLQIEHGEHSPGAENGWHTDVTWMERPSLGSIAQCVVKPPYGGDTLFSDSHACYLGLPGDLQQQIAYLDGINDYRLFLSGRGSGALPDELIDAIKREIPFGVAHPLVRTHPETGKPALYIHGGFLRHDSLFDSRTGEALEASHSKKLVRALLGEHARQEYICRFEWEEGSIAFWDNRAVQHYAASDYYPHRRVLRRITVSGDRPYSGDRPAGL